MANIPPKLQAVLDHYKGTLPVPLVEIAHDLDIAVYMTDDLANSEAGLIRRNGENHFEVYLNSNQPSSSRQFTLAHEIAHRVLHEGRLEAGQEHVDGVAQYVGVLRNGDTSGMSEEDLTLERAANELADEIVMPAATFTEVWKKYALTQGVERVAREFGVSESTVTLRAAKLLGLVIP